MSPNQKHSLEHGLIVLGLGYLAEAGTWLISAFAANTISLPATYAGLVPLIVALLSAVVAYARHAQQSPPAAPPPPPPPVRG